MITPSQIREKKISTVESGGYDRDEVNELLLEVIESYEAVYSENKELYRKMEILANRIEEYRADEDSIKTALISAQKTANKILSETKEKAAKSIEESASAAQKTVVEAKEKADKIISSARDYVAELTGEKEKAADELVVTAEKKANDAINGANVVAKDVLSKAKLLSQELIGKAKAERESQIELAKKLQAQSTQFRKNLVEFYENQLEMIKNSQSEITADEITENEATTEDELNRIFSKIDSITNEEPESEKEEPETVEPEEAKAAEEIPEAPAEEAPAEETPAPAQETDNTPDAPEEAAAQEAELVKEEQPASDEATIDEIIDEIEEIEDIEELDDIEEIEEIEEIKEAEADIKPDEANVSSGASVSREETKEAINAFSSDEITPLPEDAAAVIPEIDDEPEIEEKAMPFESYFHINKEDPHNTNETISLIPEDDDDDDEEETSKFKGFFKKKK